MKRYSLKRWLGACLFSSILAAGCQHDDKSVSSDYPQPAQSSYTRSTSSYGKPGGVTQGDSAAQSYGPPGSQGYVRDTSDSNEAKYPTQLNYKYGQPWQTSEKTANAPIGYPGSTPTYDGSAPAKQSGYPTTCTNPNSCDPSKRNCYNPEDYRNSTAQAPDQTVPPYRKPTPIAETGELPKPEWPDAPAAKGPDAPVKPDKVERTTYNSTATKPAQPAGEMLPTPPGWDYYSPKKPSDNKMESTKTESTKTESTSPAPVQPAISSGSPFKAPSSGSELSKQTPLSAFLPPIGAEKSATVEPEKSIKPTVMNMDNVKPNSTPSEAVTPARAATEATAKAEYGHAEDYHWLNGQVQYSRISKAWRLRYAPVDQVDAYGGSVNLIDDGTLGNLKDGQYVRVQGQLIGSQEKAVPAKFKADSIQTAPEKN